MSRGQRRKGTLIKEGGGLDKFAKKIIDITKTVNTLKILVKDNTNTKVEIKTTVSKLVQQAQTLGDTTKETGREMMQAERWKENTMGKGRQTVREEKEGSAEMVGLRRENMELLERNKRLEEIIRKITEGKAVTPEEIGRVDSFADFEEIEPKMWAEEVFRTTHTTRESLKKIKKDMDLLITVDTSPMGKNEVKEEIQKTLEEKYPELEELEGKLAILTISTKTEGEGQTSVSERKIIRAGIENIGDDWFKTLMRIREGMVKGNRQRIAVYPPKNDDGGKGQEK